MSLCQWFLQVNKIPAPTVKAFPGKVSFSVLFPQVWSNWVVSQDFSSQTEYLFISSLMLFLTCGTLFRLHLHLSNSYSSSKFKRHSYEILYNSPRVNIPFLLLWTMLFLYVWYCGKSKPLHVNSCSKWHAFPQINSAFLSWESLCMLTLQSEIPSICSFTNWVSKPMNLNPRATLSARTPPDRAE